MGARIVVCRWSAPLELAMPCSARRATSSSCMGRLGAHAGAKNVLMPTPLRSLSWGALTHGARDGPCRKGRRCHGGAHRGVQVVRALGAGDALLGQARHQLLVHGPLGRPCRG